MLAIDTSKSISSVTYNGVNIPLAGGGSDFQSNMVTVTNPHTVTISASTDFKMIYVTLMNDYDFGQDHIVVSIIMDRIDGPYPVPTALIYAGTRVYISSDIQFYESSEEPGKYTIDLSDQFAFATNSMYFVTVI